MVNECFFCSFGFGRRLWWTFVTHMRIVDSDEYSRNGGLDTSPDGFIHGIQCPFGCESLTVD